MVPLAHYVDAQATATEEPFEHALRVEGAAGLDRLAMTAIRLDSWGFGPSFTATKDRARGAERQHPEIGVYQDPLGGWFAEARGYLRPVSDRDVLRTGDDGLWRIHLPTSTVDTLKDSHGPLLLANLELTFLFTRDEEHIEVRARCAGAAGAATI